MSSREGLLQYLDVAMSMPGEPGEPSTSEQAPGRDLPDRQRTSCETWDFDCATMFVAYQNARRAVAKVSSSVSYRPNNYRDTLL